MASSDNPSQKSKSDKPRQSDGRPISVLVVDDMADSRDYLKDLLERIAGFRVETAATFFEALTILNQRAFDAVVADLRLSRSGTPDGGHLLDQVQASHPGIPCLVLASVDPGAAQIAESCGWLYYGKGTVLELVALIRQSVPRAS